jgi:hypothetical protein
MDNSGNFDWRADRITHITQDWGKFKKGDPIRPTLIIKTISGSKKRIEFPLLQSLSFNRAISAAKEAEKLKKSITYYQKSDGIEKIAEKDLVILFDYFEYCMITVTFCYQALETYANYIIVKKIHAPYPLHRIKNGKELEQFFDKRQIQRFASIEEKMGIILPDILKIKSPKGTKIWKPYKNLKKIRDESVHVKIYPETFNGEDKDSILYLLYNCEPKEIVNDTLKLVEYFSNAMNEKKWSDKVRTILNSDEQKDRYYDY